MPLSPSIPAHLISNYVGYLTPRDLDSMPDNCQGVYAWYAPPPTRINPPVDEKVYNYFISVSEASGAESVVGKRYKAGISKVPFKKQSYFLKCLDNVQAIEMAALAVVFSSPLYVGKACGVDGIKGRIRQEVNDKEFRRKFTKLAVGSQLVANFNVRNCLIKYVDVRSYVVENFEVEEGAIDDFVDDACKFLEQAAFWSNFPPLNTKMGV